MNITSKIFLSVASVATAAAGVVLVRRHIKRQAIAVVPTSAAELDALKVEQPETPSPSTFERLRSFVTKPLQGRQQIAVVNVDVDAAFDHGERAETDPAKIH